LTALPSRPRFKTSPAQSSLETDAKAIRERQRIAEEREARNADHGTMGMAMTQRPARLLETIAAGVTVKEMSDTHLIDRMLRVRHLTQVQHQAAVRVLELHDQAGFEPRVVAGYSPRGWSGGHDDCLEEDPAIGRFRRLLGNCTRGAGDILHGLCLEVHPGRARLGTLQAVLQDLAKHWGFA